MSGHRNFRELEEQLLERPGGREALERARGELRDELSLAELRKARNFTQHTLAEALDTRQSGISRIEHQTDLYLSTLRSYIEALGGRLEIVACFHDARIPIRAFEALSDEDVERGVEVPVHTERVPV